MSTFTLGKVILSEKLVNELRLMINKSLNEITINDCCEAVKNHVIKEEDIYELIELYHNLFKKYNLKTDKEEVNECINGANYSIKKIWNKHFSFNLTTLEYLLNKELDLKYITIFSFSHLIILINYYLYYKKENYYENHYTSDDNTGIYFKEIWEKYKDKIHICQFCEYIYENEE
jgi:hypothetical protein